MSHDICEESRVKLDGLSKRGQVSETWAIYVRMLIGAVRRDDGISGLLIG